MEVESRQSVSMKIKAQWASEEKMRDVLKLSATLENIMACTFLAFLVTDLLGLYIKLRSIVKD